jgi:hypothetical protein
MNKLDFASIDVEFRQDYLNIDKSVAISAEGDIFKVGDYVGHDGSEKNAIINSFFINEETFDVMARTTEGIARISFMYHTKR